MTIVKKQEHIVYLFLDGSEIPSKYKDMPTLENDKNIVDAEVDLVFVFRDGDRNLDILDDSILHHGDSGTVIRLGDQPIWLVSQEYETLTFNDIAMFFTNVSFGVGKYRCARIYTTDDYPVSFMKFKHMIYIEDRYITISCDDKTDYLEMMVSM